MKDKLNKKRQNPKMETPCLCKSLRKQIKKTFCKVPGWMTLTFFFSYCYYALLLLLFYISSLHQDMTQMWMLMMLSIV
jgi:hypothetical protein